MSENTAEKKKPISQAEQALVVFIKEIACQLDEVASLQQSGSSASLSKKLLAEMCEVLRELPPELLNEYFKILPSLLNKSSPQRAKYSEEYARWSEPVKQKFIISMKEKLTL